MRGRPAKPVANPVRSIWVDAETCTPAAFQLLYTLATERRVMVTLVSYKSMERPNSAYLLGIVLSRDFQTVAERILNVMAQGDIVITNDASLAKQANAKRGTVVETRDASGFAKQMNALLTKPVAVAAPVATAKMEEAEAD